MNIIKRHLKINRINYKICFFPLKNIKLELFHFKIYRATSTFLISCNIPLHGYAVIYSTINCCPDNFTTVLGTHIKAAFALQF